MSYPEIEKEKTSFVLNIIKDMSVTELRTELNKRELESSGRKTALQKRLSDHLNKRIEVLDKEMEELFPIRDHFNTLLKSNAAELGQYFGKVSAPTPKKTPQGKKEYNPNEVFRSLNNGLESRILITYSTKYCQRYC